ncbi:MAG: imidazolonepropionase [Planctomycetes bacterium]|nr:imidazolonepropionase [Planctomycetota bacterium]
MKKVDLIIHNISELVTVSGSNNRPRAGAAAMNDLGIITDGALAVKDGKIIAAGTTNKIKKQYRAGKTINATGKTVTPGLIDAHTHPIFMGDRADEFELKLKGATYQEIAAKGGGIKFTVRKVRAASKQELKTNARPYLHRFINYGTTTIEAKSGYGLTLKDEIKLLEAIKEFKSEIRNPKSEIGLPDIVPTFLGAHEIPDEYKNNKQGYINLITAKMIPEVSRRKLARFCDVFCEKNVFEIDDSREILESARKYGLGLKLHADEFAPLGGAELAAQMGAVSADHLMAISDNGIKQMMQKGVVGVLLPGTTFALGLKNYAPARKMIDAGLPVALATDFNPGTSFTESLPMIMSIACVMMRMTPAEALVASTVNAAWALGEAANIGSLETGKDADIVLWSAPSYKHIPYHFGVNLVETVIQKGEPQIHTDKHG